MTMCIFKMKRVHFRLKENPFIPIYNQILGHTKKLKRVIPYISFLSWENNWMESGMFMKWWEKKHGYMPHDSIQMCLKRVLWTGEVEECDLVILLWTKFNSFPFQKPIVVGDKREGSRGLQEEHGHWIAGEVSRRRNWRQLHQKGGKA